MSNEEIKNELESIKKLLTIGLETITPTAF